MAAGAAEEEGWSVLISGTPQQKLVSQCALQIITLVALLLTVATVALHKGLPHCSCTLIQSPEDRRFQTESEW